MKKILILISLFTNLAHSASSLTLKDINTGTLFGRGEITRVKIVTHQDSSRKILETTFTTALGSCSTRSFDVITALQIARDVKSNSIIEVICSVGNASRDPVNYSSVTGVQFNY
jgi:hypothetical protein